MKAPLTITRACKMSFSTPCLLADACPGNVCSLDVDVFIKSGSVCNVCLPSLGSPYHSKQVIIMSLLRAVSCERECAARYVQG